MASYYAFVRRMLCWLSGLAVGITIVMWFMGGQPYISGWLIGCGGNILCFIYLAMGLRKLSSVTASRVQAEVSRGVLGRLMIILATILLGVVIPQTNMPALLTGLLLFRIVITLDWFIVSWIKRGRG